VGVSYLTAYAYTWITVAGILLSADPVTTNIPLVAAPLVVGAASYFLWDALRWQDYRSGLMALGVVGGALAGGFVDMVVSSIDPGMDARVASSIVLGLAVAGQAAAVLLTNGIPAEKTQEPLRRLSFIPAVGAGGAPGIAVRFSY
jgi:hypothetical protein